MTKQIRTRFAPSPTGPLHMGNVRTALFNYLFAKRYKGSFVLRIEDTDKERSTKEWEDDAIKNLMWIGLSWNEGIGVRDVSHGPYRQSERTDIYKKYLEKLLRENKAYYCFCTPEELEAQKQEQASRGEAPRYTGKCRTLLKEEIEKNLDSKKSSTIRFITEHKTISFNDLIRNKIEFKTEFLGDFIIAKNLTTSLYNFTVVIDDFEMRITHVIRGEDHIPNTPKQILLQHALGLPSVIYAHLPLLLGEDRTKLSKRHGNNSLTRFRAEGYLPEAVVNFLALLGWNPGNDKEIFSLSLLEREFSIERIQKGAAVFNIQRLDWINGFYIRQKSPKKLTELCIPFLIKADLLSNNNENRIINLLKRQGSSYTVSATKETMNIETIEKIVSLYQERLKKLSDIAEFTEFFFKKELHYSKEMLQWKKASDNDTKDALEQLENLLKGIDEKSWTIKELENVMFTKINKGDRGVLLWPLRVALTGKKASAGPFDIAEILGKNQTLYRIQYAKTLVS